MKEEGGGGSPRERRGDPERGPFLRPGETCWRVEEASRMALLVDGESYFRAFHEAVSRARRSVVVIGWDLDTRVRLLRGDGSPEGEEGGEEAFPPTLEGLLHAAVKRRKGLRVHILIWDFAMVLAHERQWGARLRLGTRHHRRLHFQLDGEHPVGASHHQKIVVVDGKVALAGGFDLTRCRWDTREHRPEDPRRTDTREERYDPFHDVQAVVDGPAAGALAELAAWRWERATGEELEIGVSSEQVDCWPESVSPHFENVKVGIARTVAAWKGQQEVQEVEALYKASIAGARRLIYIENQYLTSPIISEALARRLEEEDGPEIMIVSSLSNHGWLGEMLMDALRVRFIKRLREAGRSERLRIWYPAQPGDSGTTMTVHAKVMIVDDRLVRVGSSNLSNRSLGLDSECDLAVEESGDGRAARGIRRFFHGLLAEHLGRTAEEVRDALETSESAVAGVESLRGGERTLQPLEPELDMGIDDWLPDTAIVDPEKPVDSRRLLDLFLPAGGRKIRRPGLIWRLVLLAMFPLLAALWAWTPMREMLDPRALADAAGRMQGSVAAPLVVAVAFTAGSLMVFPVTVLIAATAYLFGPVWGTLYAMGGTLLGGAATYAVGARAGEDLARRLAGTRLDDLSGRLARRGLLAMTLVRFLPVAPFSVVNVVAGASRIRFRDFMGGTFLGMAPGTVAIALMVNGVEWLVLDPSAGKLGWLALLAAVIAGGALLIRRWVDRREKAA